MRNSARVIALLVIMAFGSAYLAYTSHTSTPEFSLRQARKAFENHDADSFTEYIDVEHVVGSLYNQVLMAAHEDGNIGLSLEMVEEPTGNALVTLVKPGIVDTTSQQLMDYVRTREFDETAALKEGGLDFSLLATWEEYCGDEKAFKGIEYVRKQGTVAHVGLSLQPEHTGRVFTLDIVMAYRDGRWHVTEVSNFSEYMSRDFEMEANRLAKRDMLISEAMQDTLILGSLKKSTTPGGLGIGENVILELELTNQSVDEIDEYAVEIICRSLDGKELGRFVIDSMEDLKPGETDRESLFKYVNMHSRDDRMLYETPQSELDITARIQYVKFSEETAIKLAALHQ
jgi:hypothetical protein